MMLKSRSTAKALAALTVISLIAPTAANAHCAIHSFLGKPQARYSAAKAPTRTASVKPAPQASKPADGYRVASQAAKPVVVAPAAPVSAPATIATNTCLTKEYLDTGAVKFQDTCTKEWAVNSTDVEKRTVTLSCLTKESSQSGVVMFRDTCTNEWAMNTLDKLAEVKVSR
jgi:hypothetical protein